MRRVAVFSTNFLEYSQTFVHEEITHHERYAVEVFCRRRYEVERFPFEPVHVGGWDYALTRHSAAFHREIGSGRFALLHGHFGTGSCYAVPYAKRHRLPLVVTFHGYDVPLLRSKARRQPKNWPYALTSDDMLRTLTLGLCASEELLEMVAEAGVPRERLRLYHLGIDLGRFQPAERTGRASVAMVGRFVEKKGFEYGLSAFAMAVSQGVDAELTIVGGGEREAALRAIVAEHHLHERVKFVGVLDSSAIAALLAKMDALLAPSVVASDGDRESGVIVVKEASACECVPIGTYHGGIPEIIDDGTTGYLVPERDVAALADRLVRVLSSREHARALGRAARMKMEREYDLSTQVRELETRYDEAIELYER